MLDAETILEKMNDESQPKEKTSRFKIFMKGKITHWSVTAGYGFEPITGKAKQFLWVFWHLPTLFYFVWKLAIPRVISG